MWLGTRRVLDTLQTTADELLARLEGIELACTRLSDRLQAISDPSALAARLTELEATIDKRLGEAAADLIAARAEYRKAANAEQRQRDRESKAVGSDTEIPEEVLEEITAALRRELQQEHGEGGRGGRMHPVSDGVGQDQVGRRAVLDEYDQW